MIMEYDVYVDPYTKEELYFQKGYLESKDKRRKYPIYDGIFPVFLPSSQINTLDEYAKGDKYNVAEYFDASFQQNRLKCSLNLLRKLGENLTVLDIGCGEGHFCHYYAKERNVKRVYGFDYSISAIRAAKEKYPELELAVADCNFLPYRKGFFDVVILNNILEHVDYPLHLLQNVNKVVRVGGDIILSTPSRYRMYNLIRLAMGKNIVFMSPSHIEEYSVGQVTNLLRHAGFTTIDIIQTNVGNKRHRRDYLHPKPLLWAIILGIAQIYIKLVHSPHQVGATIFYLGKKSAGASFQSIEFDKLISELVK